MDNEMTQDVGISPNWTLKSSWELTKSVAADGWAIFALPGTRRKFMVACYDLMTDEQGRPVVGAMGDLEAFASQVPAESRYFVCGNETRMGVGIVVQVPEGVYFDTQTLGGDEVISIVFSSTASDDLPWALNLWSTLFNTATRVKYCLEP